MVHIYEVKRPEAERKARRRISVAEINILRKFENSSRVEGRKQIEEHITRQMTKLHQLWFPNRRTESL